MSFKYLAVAAALAMSPAAFAQQAADPAAPQAGETSDRTPDKATQTPQNQQDTAGGKTSDRSQDKNVKVEHQPGAAGSASSSEGASSGTSGSSTTTPSANPPTPSSDDSSK